LCHACFVELFQAKPLYGYDFVKPLKINDLMVFCFAGDYANLLESGAFLTV